MPSQLLYCTQGFPGGYPPPAPSPNRYPLYTLINYIIACQNNITRCENKICVSIEICKPANYILQWFMVYTGFYFVIKIFGRVRTFGKKINIYLSNSAICLSVFNSNKHSNMVPLNLRSTMFPLKTFIFTVNRVKSVKLG